MKNSDQDTNGAPPPTMKKCPECFTYLQLDDKVCFACHTKVGKMDKNGIAARPVDFLAYMRCLLMWAIFFLYIWWAFLRDKP
jgi:hypothetical protein